MDKKSRWNFTENHKISYLNRTPSLLKVYLSVDKLLQKKMIGEGRNYPLFFPFMKVLEYFEC